MGKRSPEPEIRRVMESDDGFDLVAWAQTRRPRPERGEGPVESGAVFEELGAALFCGPFLSSIGLAATALLDVGSDDVRPMHLPAIAA